MEGQVLAGRYRLISMLGKGGMGSVWRAEHLTLGTPVAIKLIESSIAESPEAVARFKREAQSAAELRSVHVVQIIDFGVDDGVPFIAMELLDGESLAARLDRLGRLPAAQTAGIMSQVARALARAHAAGIIHRDLKPDNIYLVPEGDAEISKVLDFGIAKKLGLLSASSGVKTGTGAMLGTPYYMSPEQALGHTTIDHRTDIWSLGIIVYQCVTGFLPFDRETLGSLLMAICNEPLPVPSTVFAVPPGFDGWFARCCARKPEERYATALDATNALSALCGDFQGRSSGTGTARENVTLNASLSAGVVQALTGRELSHTALPAAVTIRGHQTRRKRGIVIAAAVGGVCVIGAVLAARSFERAEPIPVVSSMAVPESPTVNAPPTAVVTNSAPAVLPVATIASVAPVASVAEVPVKNNAAIAPALSRRPKPTVEPKKPTPLPPPATVTPQPVAKPVVTATPQPVTKPVEPATKPVEPATPQRPRTNYDNSVGF